MSAIWKKLLPQLHEANATSVPSTSHIAAAGASSLSLSAADSASLGSYYSPSFDDDAAAANHHQQQQLRISSRRNIRNEKRNESTLTSSSTKTENKKCPGFDVRPYLKNDGSGDNRLLSSGLFVDDRRRRIWSNKCKGESKLILPKQRLCVECENVRRVLITMKNECSKNEEKQQTKTKRGRQAAAVVPAKLPRAITTRSTPANKKQRIPVSSTRPQLRSATKSRSNRK